MKPTVFKTVITIDGKAPMIDWYVCDTVAEARDAALEDMHRYGIPPSTPLEVRPATLREMELAGYETNDYANQPHEN
jgi:hypothetical protein